MVPILPIQVGEGSSNPLGPPSFSWALLIGGGEKTFQGKGSKAWDDHFSSGSLAQLGWKRQPSLVELSGRVGRLGSVLQDRVQQWGIQSRQGEGQGLAMAQATGCRKDRVLKAGQVGGQKPRLYSAADLVKRRFKKK